MPPPAQPELPAEHMAAVVPFSPVQSSEGTKTLDQRYFVLGDADEVATKEDTVVCSAGDWLGGSIITGVSLVLTPFVVLGAIFGLHSLGGRSAKK